METSQSISNTQQNTKQCGKFLSLLYCLLDLFVSTHAQMMSTINWKSSMQWGANQICRVGRAVYLSLKLALTSSQELWSNKRSRLGVIVGMVAFPMWKCHIFFDIDARDFNWYYINWVFYLNTIRPYLSGIFLLTGFFIAAPQKWQFRWWALPVIMFCVSEVCAQSFYDDYTDFYQSMPAWEVCLITLVSAPAIMFSIDYLVYRKYHLKDGTLCRIFGIIKAPGIDAETKIKHLQTLVNEMENFNARI